MVHKHGMAILVKWEVTSSTDNSSSAALSLENLHHKNPSTTKEWLVSKSKLNNFVPRKHNLLKCSKLKDKISNLL